MKCINDIAESCRFIDKGINDQPTLVVAYLVASILARLLPGDPISGIARLFAQCLLLGVACSVARQVWLSMLDEEERTAFQISKGGAPVHSLILLQFLYYIPLLLPAFFVMLLMNLLANAFILAVFCLLLAAPATWWAIKSGLAIVLVSVEDRGAVDALLRSHRLINDRFWWTFRYLAPIFLMLVFPMYLFWSLMNYGYRLLLDQAVNLPIAIGSVAIRALLEGASYLAVQLLLVACLTRLFVYLKTESGDESEIRV